MQYVCTRYTPPCLCMYTHMHPLSDKAKLIKSLQKYKRHHCAIQPVQATIANQVDKSLSQDDVFAHLLGFIFEYMLMQIGAIVKSVHPKNSQLTIPKYQERPNFAVAYLPPSTYLADLWLQRDIE